MTPRSVVWTPSVTPPTARGPGASQAMRPNPPPSSRTAGTTNSHSGQCRRRNFRFRHPSRSGRRWGGRPRPSGWSTIGTSLTLSRLRAALTIISLANSIPSAVSPRRAYASARNARSPHWQSPMPVRKNRFRIAVRAGLPT